MKNIEEIVKIIKNRISSWSKEEILNKMSNSGLAWAAFNIFKGSITTECYPDFYSFSEAGFGGGDNGWAVGIYQPQPNPLDAWGRPIEVDRINIGLPEGAAYVNNIDSIITETTTKLDKLKSYPNDYVFLKKALNKKYKFFKLTLDEQEQYFKYIGQYIMLDNDDIRNSPGIAVSYGIFCHNNTDCKEWNALVKWAESIEKIRKVKSKKKEFFSFKKEIKKEYDININIVPNKNDFYHIYWNNIDLGDNPNHIKLYFKGIQAAQKYEQEYQRLRNGMLQGETPVAYYHSFEANNRKYVCLENGTLKVPKKLMGKAIGKGGENIKGFQKFWNLKVKLVETSEKGVSFNWQYYYNSLEKYMKTIDKANSHKPKNLPKIIYRNMEKYIL